MDIECITMVKETFLYKTIQNETKSAQLQKFKELIKKTNPKD